MSALNFASGDPIQRLIASRAPRLSGPAADVLGQGGDAQRPDPALPLLQPQEEESVMQQLGHAGLGALHFLGSTLDKTFGGRAIRGVLGGRPEELASVIPLSDQLGLSNEDNRVSGEDLLKQWGVLGERDPSQGWLQARDAAGPLTEMALDPATYLTFGTGSALTEAGEQAAKEGTLAATAAERIARGQSGLVGVGLPFSKPAAVLGSGPAAQRVAGAIDSGVDRALYSYPGRALSMLFDKGVGGTFSENAQRAARAVSAAAPAAEAAARSKYLEVGNPLLQAGLLAPEKAQQTGDMLTAVLEGRASPLPTTAGGRALGESAARARSLMDEARAAGQAAGRRIGEGGDSLIDYAPRQMTPLDAPTRGYGPAGGLDFPTVSPNQRSRLEAFRDVPGGRPALNAMSVDPAISGPDRTIQNGDAYIRHTYLGGSPAEDAELQAFRNQPPLPTDPAHARWVELEARQQKSEDLAEIMAGMDPQRAAGGKPLFANHQLSDIGSYLINDARATQGALARHQILAGGAAIGPASHETVSALEALEQAGLNHNTAAMQGGQLAGGQAALMDALRARGINPANLSDVRVSKDAVADAVRYGSKGFQAPPSIRPPLDAYDALTNLTKGWMSSFWPSSIARDELTGLWQHAANGVGSPADALVHQAAADALRSGKTVAGAAADYFPGAAGLSDEQASRMLRDEMFVHGAWGGHGQASDAVGLGTHAEPGGPLLPNAPAAAKMPLLEEANPLRAVPKSAAEANPLALRGVGGRTETGNSLVRYGQELRDSIYETQAGGTYLSLRKQGYAPAEAAKRSLGVNYDYGNLTPFESNVMRRAMPFYNWTRQNLPNQIGQLLTRPGGMAGAAIRGADDLRSNDFVPDYISEGVGVPVGAESNGTQRYLTELGLPWEDVLDLAAGGPNPLARAGEKMLSNLNPLIKGPLEYATGKQFYSDRDLADLHGISATGNSAIDTAVNQAVMNSPLQRFYGLYHTATDPRKDLATKILNEVAPTKVTDVDMEKARSISARDQIEESLRGNPNVRHFTELYVRPEDAGNLSPDEARMMRLYKTLEAAQTKKSKQHAK